MGFSRAVVPSLYAVQAWPSKITHEYPPATVKPTYPKARQRMAVMSAWFKVAVLMPGSVVRPQKENGDVAVIDDALKLAN